MVRLCGACCGLTLFCAMLTYGLLAGADVQPLLLRAVAVMAAGVVLGSVTGWLGLAIMRENINLPEDSAMDQAEPDNVVADGAGAPPSPRGV